MYFIIDYENVNYNGLEGAEYLLPSDNVSIFYGDACGKIINYRLEEIERSNCEFEIFKLLVIRKNALDFYITSKVGEIFALNPDAMVAIISGDRDHNSVMEYWHSRLKDKKQLVMAKTIAKAICDAGEENERKKIVEKNMNCVDLYSEFVRIDEKRKLTKKLKESLADSEYKNMLPQIMDIMYKSESSKVLYLNAIKNFGKKTGTEVYRQIKDYALCSVSE